MGMTRTMTPGAARDDLGWAQALARNEAGGGDWEDVCETLSHALETIAGMREEWGVEVIRHGESAGIDWCHNRQEAADLAADKDHFPPSDAFRIVRRYVTAPEVIDGERANIPRPPGE